MSKSIKTIPTRVKGGIYNGRLHREFFAVTDDDVILASGYGCEYEGQTTPVSLWWCPSVGFTASKRGSLFDTEKEALIALENKLFEEQTAVQNALYKIRQRLHKL